MDYTKLMAIGDSLQDLLNNGSCLFFRETNFGHNLIEELSTFAKFSYQVVPFVILEDLV
jgi:hypothetical protein